MPSATACRRPGGAVRGALLGALLGLAALAGCGRAAPPSLVLVTLDTTRVDHLSCYGYPRETSPNLDRLAAESVRYTRAWSTSSWTLPAHASLFTGLYPASHGAHFDPRGAATLGDVVHDPVARRIRAGKLVDARTTLAEVLASHGYRTGAFVAGPWLHRDFGLLQGFETKSDEVESAAGRTAQEITDRAIGWLEEQSPAQPFFLLVNYFDPHVPYHVPEGAEGFGRAREDFDPTPLFDALLAGTLVLGAAERAVLVDRYDSEIRYMDHHLGRLLEALRDHEDGPGLLVIVTADHGEQLGEQGRYMHGHELSEALLRVPLLVRHPDRRGAGRVDDTPVQLVDLFPLALRELGIPEPPGLEGRVPGSRTQVLADLHPDPLAAERYGGRYRHRLSALLEWPYKLVSSDGGERTLYRLAPSGVDETEHDDAALRERLQADLEVQRGTAPADVVPPERVDPATHEALRGLGYVE